MTDGHKPISNGEFYMRFAQRIIHILTTATSTGKLYDVDTRLRPSGSAGLLVSSFQGYIDYQKQHAWIWEHQALVRARIITGSHALIERFNTIRSEMLSTPHVTLELKKEVQEMRHRMRDSAVKHPIGYFDVGQGEGGIKDIEFIVQFGVLNWGQIHPAIFKYTDNIRVLEAFENHNLLAAKDVKHLSDAYCVFRKVIHHSALQNESAWIKENEWITLRHEVIRIWQLIMDRD